MHGGTQVPIETVEKMKGINSNHNERKIMKFIYLKFIYLIS